MTSAAQGGIHVRPEAIYSPFYEREFSPVTPPGLLWSNGSVAMVAMHIKLREPSAERQKRHRSVAVHGKAPRHLAIIRSRRIGRSKCNRVLSLGANLPTSEKRRDARLPPSNRCMTVAEI